MPAAPHTPRRHPDACLECFPANARDINKNVSNLCVLLSLRWARDGPVHLLGLLDDECVAHFLAQTQRCHLV